MWRVSKPAAQLVNTDHRRYILASCAAQGMIQFGTQVFHVLDAHRQAHQIVVNA